MSERTPGSIIYGRIDKDDYLHELYEKILLLYSEKIFGLNHESTGSFSTSDALRYADLLSKSTHPKKSDTHKIWAQEIVALLNHLIPNKLSIEHYFGSILSNTGNFRGRGIQAPTYKSLDLLDRLYSEYDEDTMSIPAEPLSTFFHAQKQIYDMLSDPYLSYSGPTSMGKSFVMRMLIKKKLIDDEKLTFAIVVPTKALINEVSAKIEKDLEYLLTPKNYKIVNSPGSLFLKGNHNFIFVITPERLLYLLTNPQNKNIHIDYLFVDEAHKISSTDARSTLYYKSIDSLFRKTKTSRIIFASPNIPNPQVFLKLLPKDINDSYAFASTYSPVSQIKYFIDFHEKTIEVYNKYSKKSTQLTTINDTDDFISWLSRIGQGKKNIIYCSSKQKSIKLANDFITRLDLPILTSNVELMKLAKDIEDEIHEDCFLANMVRRGIAYHVGYLPTAIKTRIEEQYKKETDGIKTLFCTSTLVEGINLPADNLFITSYYNGPSPMSDVDFANLVGRVGRIDFNLYGNVFLTRLEKNNHNTLDNFNSFLKGKVKKQQLSIVQGLSDNQKKNIIDCLTLGSMEFPKCPHDQSEDDYNLMRKFAIILIGDILKGYNTLVYREFLPFMQNGIETRIRTHFEKKADKIDDDINVSVDQVENLHSAIKKGLAYPPLSPDGFISHDDLLDFLLKLCKIFKWDRYEKKTLGNLCRKHYDNNGQCGQTPACHYCRRKDPHSSLSFYAVVLGQWLQGKGVKRIIQEAIANKIKNPVEALVLPNKKKIDYDHRLTEHRNIVIGDTLDVIDQIVLFKISNYFLKFSAEYKRFHNIESMPNDWYEYVEYGTTNETSIFFQKYEIERQTANYIKENNYFINKGNGIYKIKNSIKNCDKDSIRLTINRLLISVPELFED